jgi:hypothetical protein
MTSNDEPSATDVAQHALPAPPAPTATGALSPGRPGILIAHRARPAAARRRPWWKWLLIGVLLAFSLATTGLYAVALIGAISRHHWAAALDASRDAVPAAVGWAALLLLFFPRGTPEAERLLSADNHALSERLRQAARDQASMDNAEQKVQRLTAKLARLSTVRERTDSRDGLAPEAAATPADSGVTYLDPGAIYLDPDDAELGREVAETTARLEQARQWLTSARDAVAASQLAVADAEDRLMSDFPDLAPRRPPDRAAHKPA